MLSTKQPAATIRRLPFPSRKRMHVADWNNEFRKFRRVWSMLTTTAH